MLLDKRELVERARCFHFIFSIEIDSLRPSSAMQTDFSEIVKLGLDARQQETETAKVGATQTARIRATGSETDSKDQSDRQ